MHTDKTASTLVKVIASLPHN